MDFFWGWWKKATRFLASLEMTIHILKKGGEGAMPDGIAPSPPLLFLQFVVILNEVKDLVELIVKGIKKVPKIKMELIIPAQTQVP